MIVSITCLCLLGIFLFMRPSETKALTDPKLKRHTAESRAIPRRITSGDTAPPTKVPSDFNEMTSYLPADLRHLRFGLTLADFKSFEPDLTYETIEGVRLHATKKNTTGEIVEINAYFELADPHIYYELIVVFNSESQRDHSAAALLNKPNFGEEWLIPLNDQTAIHAWKAFEDKLVYKHLPKGSASVHDDLPTPQQMEELQKSIEQMKETIRIRDLQRRIQE